MRRGITIAMVFFGFNMLVTAIMNLFPPFDTMFFPPHAVNSFAFGILAIIHVWLNWKPIVRYFKGLGWWWLPVALAFIAIVVLAIIPIIRG